MKLLRNALRSLLSSNSLWPGDPPVKCWLRGDPNADFDFSRARQQAGLA
jgi:hypothetical protein